MTIGELLEEALVVRVDADLGRDVTGLAYDSRRVRRGDLFFALAGRERDGLAYARDAFAAGAIAAVVETGAGTVPGPSIEVSEPRRALASAAVRFHRHPAREMKVVGVTGTNGKTTTTFLLESIFHAAGLVPGVIGTTGTRLAGEWRPAAFTTPEAPELQALLREMADRGVRAVALEVSSHALAQRRSFGLECDVVVFTNLSHDHLDYHGTMEGYLDAKLMLFDGRNAPSSTKRATAVVNADDPHAPGLIAAAGRARLAIVSYGEAAGAAVRIDSVAPVPRGLAIVLHDAGRAVSFELPLLGRYNAWNAAAAYAAARALGIDAADVVRGLASVAGVPGRLERVDEGQDFQVVVDYAHTPDALDSALRAAREHGRGRTLLVFGAGGDRDRAKRAPMGEVAARLADTAWVTSDNPRREDPGAIAAEVMAGAPAGKLRIELDRRAAIAAALAAARPGDTVVIAGKGHETTQTIGENVRPFDDRAVARELLHARKRDRG